MAMEKMGEKVVREIISTGGKQRTDAVHHNLAAAPGAPRFDRTYSEAEWPGSARVQPRAAQVKVVWKHDAAPGMKE
jgi:hypothetical protein